MIFTHEVGITQGLPIGRKAAALLLKPNHFADKVDCKFDLPKLFVISILFGAKLTLRTVVLGLVKICRIRGKFESSILRRCLMFLC